jgi:1-phosphofructokinase family hexose kinase
MFLCVSPNPAIDKRLTVATLQRGRVNRAQAAQSFPGGKSAHVAMVLRTLGADPHWIGPTGGPAGEALLAGLRSLGISAANCPSVQPTRTNLEVVEEDGTVTEILEPGAALCPSELQQFERLCQDSFAQGGANANAIFSGSLPANTAPNLYANLIASANTFGCKSFLDASGEPLRLALAAKPYFAKPNREEAAHLLGAAINTISEAVVAVRQLLVLGAQSAALSLGSQGLLFSPGQNHPLLFAPALPLQPRSTVGCGDSALAGFAFAIAARHSPQDALRLAAACAAANCLADSPGAATLADIRTFQQQIEVQTL